MKKHLFKTSVTIETSNSFVQIMGVFLKVLLMQKSHLNLQERVPLYRNCSTNKVLSNRGFLQYKIKRSNLKCWLVK